MFVSALGECRLFVYVCNRVRMHVSVCLCCWVLDSSSLGTSQVSPGVGASQALHTPCWLMPSVIGVLVVLGVRGLGAHSWLLGGPWHPWLGQAPCGGGRALRILISGPSEQLTEPFGLFSFFFLSTGDPAEFLLSFLTVPLSLCFFLTFLSPSHVCPVCNNLK